MSRIIVLFLILSSSLCLGQENPLNRQIIDFGYFKLKKPNGALFDAVLYHGLTYSIKTIDTKGSSIHLKFNVKVDFVIEKSYFTFINPIADSLLLKHEQGHSDIAILNARKLLVLLNNCAYKKDTYRKKVDSLFMEACMTTNREHDAYDRETAHGLNQDSQAKWNGKLLDAFK